MQMLCKPSFDLFDSMNSFESMHEKMDSRMHRASALTVKTARDQGIIVPDLTDKHRHALISELLVQFATWQDQNALLLQTLYSCIYLSDHSLYDNDAVLAPLIKAILYVINCFYRHAIYSNVLRDEDV
jgi:hypothetical protein